MPIIPMTIPIGIARAKHHNTPARSAIKNASKITPHAMTIPLRMNIVSHFVNVQAQNRMKHTTSEVSIESHLNAILVVQSFIRVEVDRPQPLSDFNSGCINAQ
jgi:hypothetical protein